MRTLPPDLGPSWWPILTETVQLSHPYEEYRPYKHLEHGINSACDPHRTCPAHDYSHDNDPGKWQYLNEYFPK